LIAGLDGLGYRDATAVVVGCSTGIGAATAQLLHELGARLHTVSRNPPSVPSETFHPLDLNDPDAIAATAASLREIGPIDYFFVCAGVPLTRPPREVIQVNYFGVRQLVDAVLPAIVDGGSIGVMSSNTAFGWEARLPILLDLVGVSGPTEAAAWCDDHADLLAPGYATYALSKQAMLAWVADRAPTLGWERGIRINCTLPGPTDTPMVDEIASTIGNDVFDAYPHPVLGRIATAEEQAWPMLLLCSRLNNVVSGTVLFCDEGVSGGLLTGSVDLSKLDEVPRKQAG
jgi:NAD(P)-dependent dehydrogenase (short-subunit alcohol dehydrogenase family)